MAVADEGMNGRGGAPAREVAQLDEQGEEKQGQSRDQPGFKVKNRRGFLAAYGQEARMLGVRKAVKPH